MKLTRIFRIFVSFPPYFLIFFLLSAPRLRSSAKSNPGVALDYRLLIDSYRYFQMRPQVHTLARPTEF